MSKKKGAPVVYEAEIRPGVHLATAITVASVGPFSLLVLRFGAAMAILAVFLVSQVFRWLISLEEKRLTQRIPVDRTVAKSMVLGHGTAVATMPLRHYVRMQMRLLRLAAWTGLIVGGSLVLILAITQSMF